MSKFFIGNIKRISSPSPAQGKGVFNVLMLAIDLTWGARCLKFFFDEGDKKRGGLLNGIWINKIRFATLNNNSPLNKPTPTPA